MTTTNLAIDPRENAVRRWWRNPANRIPVLVFVTARLLTLIAGIVAVQSGPIRNQFASDPIFVQSMEARQLDNPLTFLVEPWHRWDTGWYMKIAVKGYDANDGSIIFAPLYPALMATLGKFVGDTLLAGLLISSAACLIFLLIFYRITFLETGSNSAAQSTLFAFMAFPTAFYLMAGYTESTFLVFVAGGGPAGPPPQKGPARGGGAPAPPYPPPGAGGFFARGWGFFFSPTPLFPVS